ncbi:hypothetical protein [Halobacteriovorax sp.]|uniref:hypothetical protein n=1 Tax=Halobacteriovorax sp. TaxID=2020862 RepID=UPI003AF30CEC
MLNNIKLLLGLFSILLSITPTDSYASYWNSCHLNNLRVNNVLEHEGKLYIGFENLEDKSGLVFDKNAQLTQKEESIKQMLLWAAQSKNNYFDLELDAYACRVIEMNKGTAQVYHDKSSALSSIKSDKNEGCICDVTNTSTPTMFMLPTMNEIGDILEHMAGFNDEQIANFQGAMLDMFANMNPQRSQANSMALPLILLEKISLMGVEKISNTQLAYLVGTFQDQLKPKELELLEDIVNQIDNIEFKKDRKGNTVVKLNTFNGDIKIRSEDIPMNTQEQREALAETLHYAEIEDGATLIYEKTDGDIGRYKKVEIDGIKVEGNFPVIGNLRITPRRATINLDDDDVPAQVKVSFKKLVSVPWTFDIKQ